MKKGIVTVPVRACAHGVLLVCVIASAAPAQTVPAPWTNRDIGAPALAGSVAHAQGTFTIQAAGADIFYASDQFHFVYQQISGDVDIRARVDSVTAAHAWSKAGVMIRGALTGNAAHAFAVASASRGYGFHRRPQAGGLSYHTSGGTAGPPRWVRLARAGTRVTSYASADGVSWTVVGSETIALGTTAYVGIAVTSHNILSRTTAVVSNVAVSTAAFPAGQQSADVGAVAIRGSASHQQGTYRITAAGADIWDTADQFHYVYLQMTGDVDVRARVASIEYVHRWSKAGVMVRESLAANARHAYVAASAGAGYAFQRRAYPGAYSEHTAGGSGAPPGWLRLVRIGSQFQAYRSVDGKTWTSIGSDAIPMGASVYVGLAVTSHDVTRPTTAVIDNFTAVAAAPAGNQPPVVSLTAPANGATYTAPANLTLTAAASDPEGRLGGVAFFVNGVQVGVDVTSPFSLTLTSLAAGSYSIAALVWDVEGAYSDSAPATVTVGNALPPPRAVAFKASSDHATLVTSYVLRVYAATSDPLAAQPVATSSLGKPAPNSAGEIVVDRSTFFAGLPAGSYVSVVAAVGLGGEALSPTVPFTR